MAVRYHAPLSEGFEAAPLPIQSLAICGRRLAITHPRDLHVCLSDYR